MKIKLPALLQINLSANRLSKLDHSIIQSEQLTSLDLSANPDLEQLPNDIFEKLVEIKTLNVEGTKLTKIPRIPEYTRFNDLNLKNIPLDW